MQVGAWFVLYTSVYPASEQCLTLTKHLPNEWRKDAKKTADEEKGDGEEV